MNVPTGHISLKTFNEIMAADPNFKKELIDYICDYAESYCIDGIASTAKHYPGYTDAVIVYVKGKTVKITIQTKNIDDIGKVRNVLKKAKEWSPQMAL